jgi:hypothetical protein
VLAVKIDWTNKQLTQATITRTDGAQADVYLFGAGGNWYYTAAKGLDGLGPPLSLDLQNLLERERQRVAKENTANAVNSYWRLPTPPSAAPVWTEETHTEGLPAARLHRRRRWWHWFRFGA